MNKDDDDNDNELWHALIKDIRPLPQDRTEKPGATGFRKEKVRRRSVDVPPLPADSGRTEGGVPGLDHRTEDRLRRGKMPIEARLDLHGMTQDQAYAALSRFIAASYAEEKRCVLIITGRGRAQAPGVLRARLPEWLQGPPLAGVILRVIPAQPRHGGSGAFYVLLRRQR